MKFTKFDLSQAYQLYSDSKKYVVINMHKRLYQYTCLPYGISSAPGIFQKEMDILLVGIPGVIVYLDDIVVMNEDKQKLLQTLKGVVK